MTTLDVLKLIALGLGAVYAGLKAFDMRDRPKLALAHAAGCAILVGIIVARLT